MNKSLIYLLFFLPLFALSACSDAESFDTEQQQPSSRQALTLSVCASDFATYSDGALDTRAANSGTKITFAEGDRVGVIITDAAGNLWADNIPYTYKDGSWVFDDADGEGKAPCYYDNKATTYIVYYPYSPEANGIKTADDLKRKFPPLSNQSTEADYYASDLLLGVETPTVPLTSLSATLTHAYASVSFVSKVMYTLGDGKNTKVDAYPSISDVSFSINGDIFVAHQAADGSYCCILPASDSDVDIRYFYVYLDKTYSATPTEPSGVAANTRYTSTATYSKIYTFSDARMGDFYCKEEDKDDVIGNAYLIPGDITTELTSEQKDACLGIVLKVDKDAEGIWKDDCDYKLKDGTTPMTIRGYVLALYDANEGKECEWGSYGTKVNHLDMNREEKTGFYGYKNTNAIKAFATDNGMALNTAFPATYHATVGYEAAHPSPANSSGWFLPSAGQCQYWFNNGNAILASVNKATGESYSWQNYYWSSSEFDYDPASGAWVVSFSDGYVDGGSKGYGVNVRGVFAF